MSITFDELKQVLNYLDKKGNCALTNLEIEGDFFNISYEDFHCGYDGDLESDSTTVQIPRIVFNSEYHMELYANYHNLSPQSLKIESDRIAKVQLDLESKIKEKQAYENAIENGSGTIFQKKLKILEKEIEDCAKDLEEKQNALEKDQKLFEQYRKVFEIKPIQIVEPTWEEKLIAFNWEKFEDRGYINLYHDMAVQLTKDDDWMKMRKESQLFSKDLLLQALSLMQKDETLKFQFLETEDESGPLRIVGDELTIYISPRVE